MTDRTITIERRPLNPDIVTELKHLIVANHAEVGGAPLDPQWMTLYQMHVNRALKLFVVYVDGVAVGYCAHLVTVHPLHGELWSHSVAVYLVPAWRRLARRLVEEVEAALKADGVAWVAWGVPEGSPGLRMLRRLGYGMPEVTLRKRVAG